MTVVALIFLQFLVSSQSQCRKLTTEENELNSKKCGVQFLGQPIQRNRLVKKSYGGREFEENEYPWTAALLRNEQAFCSGVQISPRHILTATHCVLVFDGKERIERCRMNQSHSIVSYMAMPEDVLVAIGGGKTNCNSFPCQYNKNLYRAKKIAAKELSMCVLKDDLALIELSQNISEDDSTAICMPKDDLQLNSVLYASGIGIDRDSGGPLFQVNKEGRHILVGIDSSSRGSCKQHNKNMVNRFTDVRANLEWICKYSGVCPVEEEPDSTTT